MGLPYWGYSNLVPDATITARTAAASPFDTAALNKRQLHPAYRSSSRALDFDGSAYATLNHHADFNISGDLSIQALIEPDEVAAETFIADKFSGTDGYKFTKDTDKLRLYIHNSGTTDCDVVTTVTGCEEDTPSWILANYDCSVPEISFWRDGSEIARANNSTQTGCTLTGTIPTSIGTNTTRLTIGADSSGTSCFDGAMGFVCLSTGDEDHGGFIQPTTCAGHWGFDGSNLTDSSGNDHTLTGTGISAEDYVGCTAYTWIKFVSSATQNPMLLFGSRFHNLTSAATVRLLRDDPYASFDSVATPTVTANQPIVSRFSSTTNTIWWLLINDPGNTDGYLEIPDIYLGPYTSMERAHLREYDWSEPRPGVFQKDALGGITGCVKGEQGWSEELKFRANAADLATLQSVIDEVSLARPVVFCEDVDNETTKTRLVQLPSALTPKYKHIIGSGHWVWLPVEEVPCGL